ncbi:MAG TPA: cation:proton antiporter [Stellaceae bacterium]|nr:cation:proton antiporter [Stellaceae bacterium]
MHGVVLTVFAVSLLLALVSLLPPLSARLNIPYAVLLAVAGCALGGLGVLAGSGAGGEVGAALRSIHLNSDAFLFIFLPTLLFETAINVDVRRLFDEIASILLLAVVAVVVSAFAVGFALWPLAGVGLAACLMLGAILATTDPVAVVAIFRDIGAPRRLSILVEGESLFNDAAAIVLFGLLTAILTGAESAGPVAGVIAFLRSFLGGLALGAVAGALACAVLPIFREHPLAAMTMTIALAYLAFVIGDHDLHVSGVVAAVSAGLVLGDAGRRRLSPSNWERLAESWEQLGFWASSLIFLLAAMLVPRLLADLRLADLGLLAVLIAGAFAARAATLFGLMPLLSWAGLAERVGAPYKLVILWGGMRGAVSLALALAATENDALPPEIRRFVAILATGFVLFTLFVNAPSLRALMRALRLDRLSPAEQALRDRALALAQAEIDEGIARIAHDYGIAAAPAAAPRRVGDGTGGEDALLRPEARAYAGLVILADREQELYLEHFDGRTVSRDAVADLLSDVGRLHDGIKTGGRDGYLRAAASGLQFGWKFRLALWVHHVAGSAAPLARQLARRFEMLVALRLVLEDLAGFNEAKVRPLFGEETAAVLRDALAVRRADTARAAEAVRLQYPSYTEALERQFLALSALRLEDESQRRLREEAILSQEVFNHLQRELGRRRRALERRPRLDLGLSRADLVARVAMFARLSPALQGEITRLLRPRLAVPGEIILRRGERGDAMYFISSGAVEVRLDDRTVALGSGEFFGELALLDDRPRNADVVALGYSQLLLLRRPDFERVMRRDESLRAHVHAVARERRGTAGN